MHYHNSNTKDFAPDCLKILAEHYGRLYSLQWIKNAYEKTHEVDAFLKLSSAAEKIGFRSLKYYNLVKNQLELGN